MVRPLKQVLVDSLRYTLGAKTAKEKFAALVCNYYDPRKPAKTASNRMYFLHWHSLGLHVGVQGTVHAIWREGEAAVIDFDDTPNPETSVSILIPINGAARFAADVVRRAAAEGICKFSNIKRHSFGLTFHANRHGKAKL
jgi:hypothetical protein